MKCHLHLADGTIRGGAFVETIDAHPECGEDFCAHCTDCLECICS